MHGFKYRYCTDPAHTPDKDIAGVKPLTRDELLARASSFGPATTKVVSSILERNAKAVPRGLHTARNVLVKLGNKHNKTTLEPACQQVIDHSLAPNMQVIARIQADIARNGHTLNQTPAVQADHAQSRIVDITAIPDAVFLRPASHYDIPKKEA